MLHRISKKMTTFFINKKVLTEADREVYDYCFEILVSTVINLIALIIIGIATAKYIETIVFAIVFMCTRAVAGGFHASTHLGCFFSLIIMYGVMLGMTFVPQELLTIISIPMMLIYLVISTWIAPVDCENKKIELDEKKALKKKLYLLNIILSILYVVLMISHITRLYAFCLAYSTFGVFGLLIFGLFKNRITRKNNADESTNKE